jgi:hypothetical protein
MITLTRSIAEPVRTGLSWDEKWKAEDRGLIQCWERGREWALARPEITKMARRGELPVLLWKGGVDKALKATFKYGGLYYFAAWQGLRGEDLHVPLDQEPEIVCARTGVTVRFTMDTSKL